MELTREQFVEEMTVLNEKGAIFNVESSDTGSVYLSLYGCNVSATLEDGAFGEITMHKPYTDMEVTIDFDIVNTITKDDDGEICLEMLNGISDVVIKMAE